MFLVIISFYIGQSCQKYSHVSSFFFSSGPGEAEMPIVNKIATAMVCFHKKYILMSDRNRLEFTV